MLTDYNYVYLVTQLMNLLLDTTSMVYSILENKFVAGNFDKDDKKTGSDLTKFRDNLNMAAFITDNGIVNLCVDIMAAPSAIAKADTTWNSFGGIKISAQEYQTSIVTKNEKIGSPSPALVNTMLAIQLGVSTAKDIADLVSAGQKMHQADEQRKADHGEEYGMVNSPTASPAGGTVVSGTQVALACSTPGAVIHYSTDGNNPSKYSSPITINQATTIKAFAVKDGLKNSLTLEAKYTIKS